MTEEGKKALVIPPTKLMEFTPENLATMEIDNTGNNVRFVRDINMPYFMVMRKGENDYRYCIGFTRQELNGARLAGIEVPAKYKKLGRDQETARAEAKRLHDIYYPLRVRKKRSAGNKYIGVDGNITEAVTQMMTNRSAPKTDPSYEPLWSVLADAYAEASSGKGNERHGLGRDFMEQDMITIAEVTGIGGPMFQAIKKLLEGRNLAYSKARKEYLGAINYIAGMVAMLDRKNGPNN